MKKRKPSTLEQIRNRVTQVFYCGYREQGAARKALIAEEARRRNVSVSGLVWIALGKLMGRQFYAEREEDIIQGKTPPRR